MAAKLYNIRLFVFSLITVALFACDKSPSSTAPPSASEPVASSPATISPAIGVPGEGEQKIQPSVTNNSFRVLDISERNKDGRNGIAVVFSSEVDSAVDVQSFIAIHAKDTGKIDGAWVLDKNRKTLWFLNTEPQTEYQITVNPGIRGNNQQQLLEAQAATLKTRPLLASVNFDSQGAVLPLGYASGLPIVSVNTPFVDLDFFRIDSDKISAFLASTNNYGRQGWYANHLKQYGKLVYSARFDLDAPKNTRVKRDIAIAPIEALQTAGLYFVVMRAAGEYDEKQLTWFTLTDIGVHLRQYPKQWDVHTNSLSSGKPLGKVTLQLLDGDSNVLYENTTTTAGSASFTQHLDKAVTLLARTEHQFTLLSLRQPTLDLSEFDLGKRPQLPVELFVYSARDLYRPGESITFSALLRDFDGKIQHSPVLSAYIQAPNGSKLKTFKWAEQSTGYYQSTWTIPADAPTGKWQLVVTGSFQAPVLFDFHVEEFLPERLKLELNGKSARTVATNTTSPLQLTVLGEYLYGAPAAGNRLSAFYQASLWRQPIDALKDYQFGHLLDDGFSAYEELSDVQLNDEGKIDLAISSTWTQVKSPLQIQVTASLYETGGRPITRSHPMLIWPAQALPGIRPHLSEKQNPEANSVVQFDIVKANLAGERLASEALEVTLINEDRQYFWEFNSNQGWHWNWTEKEFPVATQAITVPKDGHTTVSFPVEWGNYRLEVRDQDTGFISSSRFFAGYNWYYDWQNAQNASAARPDRINLALDKAHYQAGDIAQLKILPPASGEAVILVESDKPLWSQKIAVDKAGSELAIAIPEEWQQHNIYITALMIEPTGKIATVTPKRSFGLLHLPLDRSQRKLEIDFNVPEKTLPNTQLQAQIQVRKASPAGQNAFVTLAAVDVGVLNISNFKTPDPFAYFFGQRRYAVDLKDMYADVIEYQNNTQAKQRFGGDADLARGGKAAQADVQIVSLFSGLVALDAQGKADIPLDLPDFNGRIRLMALAFDEQSYGSADTDVTVAAPVVVEIAMPRFIAFGDTSTIALDVQNMTEATEQVSIELSVAGAIVGAPQNTTTQLKPKQKTTLRYEIKTALAQGQGQIKARIKTANNGDMERNWSIPVRPAYPAITYQQQVVLQPGQDLTISPSLIDQVIENTLEASLEVSPSINLNVAEQLKNLLAYPYGCLEQTTSKAQPLTFASSKAQAQFGITPITEAERLKRVQVGVDRIVAFQKGNGSFGLWDKQSAEEHWLTAYATEFLLAAQALGADVPQATLDKATTRLSYYLNNAGNFIDQRWSENNKHYAFATRAYAAYVLSRIKKAPLGSLRTLYTRDFNNAQSGLAQVHLGLALLAMGDQKNGDEALTKAVKNIPEKFGYWGDYGSEIRDLGMMIHLLIGHQVKMEEALQLSIKLKDAVNRRQWLSTQERTALFLSGLSLAMNSEQAWSGTVTTAGEPSYTLEQQQAWRKHFDAAAIVQTVQFTSTHSAPLFADLLINGYGQNAPEVVANGMDIERTWYTLKGQQTLPNKVTVGELFLVHLALTSQQRIPDALLINLLPAGFELENQNLDNAVQMDQFKIEDKTIAQLLAETQTKYTEYRDDRFVTAIDHRGYGTSHSFFLVRAVTPGVYRVPPPMAEDMYRPEIRAMGHTIPTIEVIDR